MLSHDPHILIVDDDADIRAVVRVALESRGWVVTEAGNGGEALETIASRHPDLVILDREMPGMGGMQALERLRGDPRTRHVPVIMLTSRGSLDDRVGGLDQGADDYVLKPFEEAELLARVRALLHRSREARSADPLTGLPGNYVLRRELARRLASDRPLSVAWLDLNHFKAYVDHRGFERASAVILRFADILTSVVEAEGFVGHIGGDDFLLLGEPNEIGRQVEGILDAFEAAVPEFYEEEDLERGHVPGRDRWGVRRDFPLVSVAAAVVDVEPGDFDDPEALGDFAVLCKSAVKQRGEGNVWSRYSRREPPPPSGNGDTAAG